MAANTPKLWQERMEAVKIAIADQKKLGAAIKTADRANAASTAVTEFKDKLSAAWLGLVTYYDEAVRQPSRNIGICEEVAIEALLPNPTESLAAENLGKASL